MPIGWKSRSDGSVLRSSWKVVWRPRNAAPPKRTFASPSTIPSKFRISRVIAACSPKCCRISSITPRNTPRPAARSWSAWNPTRTKSSSASRTRELAFPSPISRASSNDFTAWTSRAREKSAARVSASPSLNTWSRSTAGESGLIAKSGRVRNSILLYRSSTPNALCQNPTRITAAALSEAGPQVLLERSGLFSAYSSAGEDFVTKLPAKLCSTAKVRCVLLRSGWSLMASAAPLSEAVLYDTLVNYLVSMARTVEGAMNRSLDALVGLENPRTGALPGEVFLLEPRINEMEIVIDEHAIRLLRRCSYSDDELRLIVASLKITNDLERIGDLAVNLAERVVSLREMQGVQVPEELAPMASAVRAMVTKSLGALIFRNVEMATLVLESDDVVDQYRDRIFEQLLQRMTQEPALVSPGMQFILATRHLERIADHATNIAEDIIFWVRGLDVRHGRGLVMRPEQPEDTLVTRTSITENSHGLHPDVTPACETERVRSSA